MKVELSLTNILLLCVIILLIRQDACKQSAKPVAVASTSGTLKQGKDSTITQIVTNNYYTTNETPASTVPADKADSVRVDDSVRTYVTDHKDSVTGSSIRITDVVRGVQKSLSVVFTAQKVQSFRVDTFFVSAPPIRALMLSGEVSVDRRFSVGFPVRATYLNKRSSFSVGFEPISKTYSAGFGRIFGL